MPTFLRTPDGKVVFQGFLAAIAIAIGSFGAGAVQVHDSVLEELHLSWLRFGHGLILSSIALWVGIAFLLIAWIRLGRSAIAGRVDLRTLRWAIAAWVVPLLLSVPLYSRDAYSYLAQGALLRDGFDPYSVGPVVNPNAILDNVSGIWTTTTAPYGPAFILIAKTVTQICGNNVVLGTIVLRLTMLPGLVLAVWAVPRLARHFKVNDTVALWFSVMNPLILVHLIGGVHNEMLMVGLMVTGLVLVLERRHVPGVAVLAVAVAVKATAAIALPFVVWIWLYHRRVTRELERDPDARAAARLTRKTFSPVEFVRVGGSSVAIFAAIFAVLSLIAGVGLGWLTALSGSIKIINYLTLPTLVAQLIAFACAPFADLHLAPVLAVTRSIGVAIMAVALVTIWWRCRHNDYDAVRGILYSLIAVVLLSPASLPWYYSWPLAVAAAFAWTPRTMAIVAGASTWLMAVFLPTGSIGLYSWWNVLLAIALGVLAGASLLRADPLKVRPLVGLEPAHV